MKAMFNAKERDFNDWTSLLFMADPKFKMMGVNQLPSSRLALMEVSWNEES